MKTQDNNGTLENKNDLFFNQRKKFIVLFNNSVS